MTAPMIAPSTATMPEVQHESPGVQHESPGVWSAIRSSRVLVVLIILVFTAAGLAAGVVRHPKYSASARLAVLHLNFGGSAGALNAFSTAAPILADTYARSIGADGVVAPLATRFHTSSTAIDNDLSAASVPASPLLVITATTTSSTASVDLANAAMAQLLTYLQGVNGANGATSPLYAKLKASEATAAADRNKLLAVRSSIQHAMQTSKAVSMSLAQQAQVSAALSAATLAGDRAAADNAAYQQSLLDASNTQYLQPLQSATAAQSDRTSKLLLYAFIGLVVGIAVATGIAVLRQGRALKKLRTA